MFSQSYSVAQMHTYIYHHSFVPHQQCKCEKNLNFESETK